MKKILTIVSAVALSVAVGGCYTSRTGEKIGRITKLYRSGPICPTWEAEIIRGGFTSGSGVNGAAFDFTIEDDATAERLRQVMESQQEVKIHFHTETFYSPCRSDSGGDFLDSIESIGKPEAQVSQGAAASPAAVAPTADRLAVMQQIVRQNQELLDMLKEEAKRP
ncbi:hypothetical protein [Hyphomicrobium sp.]|uniref:hypothetical protein n=1 Tax=Hyphomicrobium sp. TaxID=82 RepID=UPI001D2CD895|nr:hypothetical protein [Hyphomicrobium sp.]MBY0559900.1 hypothetical protein [Hyphomicrobium sp.]